MKFLGLSRGLKSKRREFSSERFVEVPQDIYAGAVGNVA